ncbi:MAG: RDD family protein [Verrucomicrobiota bacterium]|nr:RDD family protein [Verrucomicrobiota bacterium]
MTERPAIEPSEIVFDRTGAVREERLPGPWLRFLARAFDYALFLLFLSSFHLFFPKFVIKPMRLPWEFVAWVPIEAILLACWGKTVGKWFLKIGVRQGRRERPSLLSACRRSISVWFRGVGMMIPLLNGLCMFIAFVAWQRTKTTSWDRDEGITLFSQPIGRWRVVFASLVSAALFLIYWV